MTTVEMHRSDERRRHEALLYGDQQEFVTQTVSYLREGLEAGDALLAVVDAPKRALLQEAMGSDAAEIRFAEMERLGRNPGRLIGYWHEFVSSQPGRRVRGVGEPAWAARTGEELVECTISESLWNVAFARHDVWVLCPYDMRALPPQVLDGVRRTHPAFLVGGRPRPSEAYTPVWDEVLSAPLGEPGPVRTELVFGALQQVRVAVVEAAAAITVEHNRLDDFVLAVSEAAGNSLRHGGGSGRLRLWRDDTALVCEIRDSGRIADPLVGRLRPHTEATRGRGLWMAHQLCDLVQVRSDASGTTVRLHLRTD